MTPLYVDYREGSKQLIEPLQKLELPAESAELESGDLAFIGRGALSVAVPIGIEFKKLSDAVSGMRTGRLQGHQAPMMARTYSFNYLVIETKGQLTWGADGLLMERSGRITFEPVAGHMKVSEYFQRLHQLHLQYGLTWVHTHSRRETLKVLETLYRTWTDKSLDEHRSHIAIYKPPAVEPVSPFMGIMSGFPGVGYELAKRLETRFITLDRMFSAPIEEWQEVAGVGREKARAILSTLTGAGI